MARPRARAELNILLTLAGTFAVDNFTARLLRVHEEASAAGASGRRRPAISLGILRSDYMVDEPTGRLLQVEVNTVASSFGSLSSLTSRLHAYLLDRAGLLTGEFAAPGALPANRSLEGIVEGLAAAWSAYSAVEAVVVMVVQPGERNVYDQQWVATELWARHRIPLVRATLAEIEAGGRLEGPDGELMLGAQKVAVAYFRAGYTPNDYPSEVRPHPSARL